MDIEVVTAGPCFGGVLPQHGPDRSIWRRSWAWDLEEWAKVTLVKIRMQRAADGQANEDT